MRRRRLATDSGKMQAGRSRDGITGTEALPGLEDHSAPFPLLSLSGVLGVAYDELSEGWQDV